MLHGDLYLLPLQVDTVVPTTSVMPAMSSTTSMLLIIANVSNQTNMSDLDSQRLSLASVTWQREVGSC